MKRARLLFSALLGVAGTAPGSVIIAHRYSFTGDLTDSVGGNTGVLQGGASVSADALVLPGAGTGPSANAMAFSSPVDLGANFGATGVTIETWYTDSGTGTWGKLFTFGTAAGGPEFAFTNVRSDTGRSGVDRAGNHNLPLRPSIGDEHHLVISLAPDGAMDLWIDGTQHFTDVATNAVSNIVSTHEAIGATAWGDPGHFGEVNEFRIYSGFDLVSSATVATSFANGPDAGVLAIPEASETAIVCLGLTGLLLHRKRRVRVTAGAAA